ncbi:MAG: FAD binding domain-containing protein [Chloroflexi bacterium]|nr:FAD binding domain-containing protein [Chloroflexota bacterium]
MTTYCVPGSISEALEILGRYDGDALIIAGGTDVLPDIRKGKRSPRCLVDITHIPGLDQITVAREYVEVGAAVTFSALAQHPYLQSHVQALVDAAAAVGSADIQNAATWAGNLVQALPAADGAVVALALEAQVLVHDKDGMRGLPVARLFAGPGRSFVDPTRQIITAVRFRIPERPWGTGWRRIGRRDSLVLPILNCATVLELAGGHIIRAAIALGPVAPTPFRATAAEEFLIGQPPGDEAFAEAARLVQRESNPRSSRARASREYRLAALPALVLDALTLASRRAQEKLELQRRERTG